jgi:hypothetical protein
VGYFAGSQVPVKTTTATSTITSTTIATSTIYTGQTSSVFTSTSEVNLTIGPPQSNMVSLTYGRSGTTFVGSQVFPVTVTSFSTIRVNFSALDVPAGTWIHFSPPSLVASLKGSVSYMTLAGAVQPFEPTDINSTLVVTASYQGGYTAESLIVIRTNNMSIITAPSPLEFPMPVVTTTNATSGTIYGVVYDPQSSNMASSFDVALSVLGLRTGAGVEPIPAGLQILIPNPSLTLNEVNPLYFWIGANASTIAAGTYDVVIHEAVGNQSVDVDLMVLVQQPTPAGG